MLITKEIEVTLCSANIHYYENLGYVIPREKDKRGRLTIKRGTKILVKIEDLPVHSHIKIKLMCDYCLEEGKETIIEKTYHDFRKQRDIELIKKDCCKKCLPKKNKEVCLKMYGVERYSQTPEIKKKISESQNHDYEFIRSEFENKGLVLISKEYINNMQDLEYVCKKHADNGSQFIKYSSLRVCKFGCRYCTLEHRSELYRHEFEFVKSIFTEKNLILLEDEYINETVKMKYRCNIHHNEIQEITFNALYHQDQGCYYCGVKNRSGENHYKWRGGVTPLTTHLREKIEKWKIDSIKSSNFKCVITGEKFDVIHHLYGFNEILQETFQELNLPIYDKINQYTLEELKMIEEKCLEIHYRYPLGVCLTNEVHDLFHREYGRGKNTPEQFEEFKQRYLNGEFNVLVKHSA